MSDKPPAAVIATLVALRRSFGQLVQFHRGTKAQGFGGANHEAIRASNGTYIVLVNTDMYVTPGWLAALLFTTREVRRVLGWGGGREGGTEEAPTLYWAIRIAPETPQVCAFRFPASQLQIPHAGLVGPTYIGNHTLLQASLFTFIFSAPVLQIPCCLPPALPDMQLQIPHAGLFGPMYIGNHTMLQGCTCPVHSCHPRLPSLPRPSSTLVEHLPVPCLALADSSCWPGWAHVHRQQHPGHRGGRHRVRGGRRCKLWARLPTHVSTNK